MNLLNLLLSRWSVRFFLPELKLRARSGVANRAIWVLSLDGLALKGAESASWYEHRPVAECGFVMMLCCLRFKEWQSEVSCCMCRLDPTFPLPDTIPLPPPKYARKTTPECAFYASLFIATAICSQEPHVSTIELAWITNPSRSNASR